MEVIWNESSRAVDFEQPEKQGKDRLTIMIQWITKPGKWENKQRRSAVNKCFWAAEWQQRIQIPPREVSFDNRVHINEHETIINTPSVPKRMQF